MPHIKKTMSRPVASYEFRHTASRASLDDIKKFCKHFAKHWVFQKETSATGYVHWQGRLSLHTKKRKHTILDECEDHDLIKPEHIEPCHDAGTVFNYVTKDEGRTEGPFKDTDVDTFVPYHLDGITMRKWQQEILDTGALANRCPRTIDVLVDSKGNNGKSIVAHYAALTGSVVIIPPVNDGEKLVQSVCSLLSARSLRDPKIIFLDLPRALPKEKLGGMMNAVEQIKNGRVFDMRYHYTEWWFHPPRVWVFTNRVPNEKDLSKDRWRYWTIDQESQGLRLYAPPSEPDGDSEVDGFLAEPE